MSITDLSFKNNFYNKNIKKGNIEEKPNYNKISEPKNNEKENNNNNDDLDEKIHENNNEKNKEIKKENINSSFNESNPNYSITRECLNYYLSYYYEQDFSLNENEEPKNAGFFARLFGNYPKIFPINQDLKSERDFIIFLKKNKLTHENDMFNKIFGKILNFFENNIYDLNTDEDKILKRKNPLNLLNKSNKLLKEKMKSFIEMEVQNNKSKNLYEEYKINSIPILMIMQLLGLIEKYPNFIEVFISKCFSNEKEIILAFSFYLSNVAFDRLLSGRLNIFFNRSKIVLDCYDDFYIGLFEQSYELLESNKYIDQEKFSRIQSEAENMPSSILWKAKTFKLKYPAMKSESSLSKYFNNSNLSPK